MGIGPGHGSREEKPDALILFSCHDIVGVTLSFLTQIFNFFYSRNPAQPTPPTRVSEPPRMAGPEK